MRFKHWLAIVAVLASAATQAQNISIATGGTGGVYYPLGGGFAAALSKHVPGMQATAEVTGGSVANLKLIATSNAYVGMTMVDAVKDAANAEGKFQGAKVNVKTLLVLYPNRMHVVTTTNTGIKPCKTSRASESRWVTSARPPKSWPAACSKRPGSRSSANA